MFVALFFIALLAGLIAINVWVEAFWKKALYSLVLFLVLDFAIGSALHTPRAPVSDKAAPFLLSDKVNPIALNPTYQSFDSIWGNHANEYSRITNSATCEDSDLLICCYGGSSTYCLGLEESLSWPSQLEAILLSEGYDVEVHNHGIPGHNLGDNLKNKQWYSCSRSPSHNALEIHYHGWNDFRLVNVPNIQYDDLDAALKWHERTARMMVGLDPIQPNTIAYNYYYMNLIGRRTARFIDFLEHHTLFLSAVLLAAHGALHEKITVQRTHHNALQQGSPPHLSEAMMMAHMQAQLNTLKHSGVQYLFIPQHLNFELITQRGTSYAYWMPGITEQKAAEYCLDLNDYDSENLPAKNYLPIIPEQWHNTHFLDYGHFSEAGCRQFAERIAEHLQANNPYFGSIITQ